MTDTGRIEPERQQIPGEAGPEVCEGYELALDCIEQGKYDRAVDILSALAGPSSRDARILYARAVALLSSGQYRKAGPDLLRTIVLDRAFLPAYLHLGYVQLTMGREESARRTLEAAIAIDPGFTAAWCMLGDVHMDCGEHDKAREAFEHALRLEPGNPEPHCKIAMYYLSRGDMAGLKRECEVLRELDPSMAEQIADLLL